VSNSLTFVDVVSEGLFVVSVYNTAFGLQFGLASPPLEAGVYQTANQDDADEAEY